VVLSHWLLDCVAWKKTLPPACEGSSKVGLTLYGAEAGQHKIKPRSVRADSLRWRARLAMGLGRLAEWRENAVEGECASKDSSTGVPRCARVIQ
jgi:hypothetical protein